jgi:hypothetical protein
MSPGKRRAVFSWSLFRKWRESIFPRWAAVAAALGGVYAVGIYLLWSVVREPLFLKWAAVAAALGVYAVGTYLLWRFVPGPLFLKWALVLVTLGGVYAVGIYLLWRTVREPLFLKWAGVVAALGVCAVGILLLWGVWDGTPVAAAFTRVGGATRVETALEASHFWLTPPRYVVKTRTDSSQVMLEAARCAIVHDAPLLFTARDPKRKRRVDAIINDWRKIRKREGLERLKVIHIKSKRQHDVTDCVGKTDIARLSTLKVPDPLIRLPQVRAQQTLASVVVFAAAIKPGHLPDVAIGLALAAHMAKANREKVSLVVVPHYLESDHGLEKKLQNQHELVTGGVVLGQTPTVPDDTRALLRQLLTSRDRQGVLGQVQENLGSVGTLITALLALAGLATAAGVGGPIVIKHLEREKEIRRVKTLKRGSEPFVTKTANQAQKTADQAKKIVKPLKFWRKGESMKAKEPVGTEETEEKSAWRTGLAANQKVTVWLRSGRQVTGTIESQIPPDTPNATVFRINNSSSVPTGPKEKHVLVSVQDIELIEFNDTESGDA